MEIQLQEFIDQIKKNGVEAAEAEAETILARANAEAVQILSNARAEAERMLSDAEAENERLVRVSGDAVRQAGRNLLISFRESVAKELQAIVGAEVQAAYSSQALSSLILRVVEVWAQHPDTEELTVLLNTEDLAVLQASLQSALKQKMLNGVTLRPNDRFDGGFRIVANGGNVYYDYSREAVTEMLSAYLSPWVTARLKEAEGV